jgi:hypothetical protein
MVFQNKNPALGGTIKKSDLAFGWSFLAYHLSFIIQLAFAYVGTVAHM